MGDVLVFALGLLAPLGVLLGISGVLLVAPLGAAGVRLAVRFRFRPGPRLVLPLVRWMVAPARAMSSGRNARSRSSKASSSRSIASNSARTSSGASAAPFGCSKANSSKRAANSSLRFSSSSDRGVSSGHTRRVVLQAERTEA